ncbi:AGE family epimerase/isomerase [Siculibacillus lacustris]|uniref:AGE family epimerase/isomerase n=1 Tax=Siculibacillus lacustris TaxID=1549641 RepID=A0A4Q9VDZ3_9HYPH|nr:AGE family epimerase/isomerase [Siculibacillus lacustris]TBW32964.1 AGE family epimerase/isomerase [Siculibacillus lacustris]
MNAPVSSLLSAHADLRAWLFDEALPLWWRIGGDRVGGGFFELLDQTGAVVEVPRRTRLVGRQIFSYAKAAAMGWDGPAKEIVDHGIDFLLGRSLAPDGTFHGSVAPDGTPLRPVFDLYDHAFALFGLAAAVPVVDDPDRLKTVARGVREKMLAGWKHPVAGFEESAPRSLPLQANPHMHIFEASLAWIEAGPITGDNGWDALADEIAELCLKRFLHPQNGALREFFDGNWNTVDGEAGRIVEPGHQFEWAWLLKRWGLMRGRPDALAAARRLVEIAETHGVDPASGLAINELFDDFSIRDDKSRLWPQTERIKAWLAMADLGATAAERSAAQERAAIAVRGLMRYFSKEVPGSWHETIRPDGGFMPAEARASSLYHITCAFDCLDAAVGGGGA